MYQLTCVKKPHSHGEASLPEYRGDSGLHIW